MTEVDRSTVKKTIVYYATKTETEWERYRRNKIRGRETA